MAASDCEKPWQHWLSISFSRLVTSHFPHVNLSLSLPGLPLLSLTLTHTLHLCLPRSLSFYPLPSPACCLPPSLPPSAASLSPYIFRELNGSMPASFPLIDWDGNSTVSFTFPCLWSMPSENWMSHCPPVHLPPCWRGPQKTHMLR